MAASTRRTLLAVGAVVVIGLLGAAGCGGPTSDPAHATEADPPVTVDEVDEEISRLTLSSKAAQRLGVETAPVGEAQTPNGPARSIPYSGIVYDADGTTWAYTNPEGLVFLRVGIVVDRIEGDLAILSEGPPIGTQVVTVAAAELWGVEIGVGGGH